MPLKSPSISVRAVRLVTPVRRSHVPGLWHFCPGKLVNSQKCFHNMTTVLASEWLFWDGQITFCWKWFSCSLLSDTFVGDRGYIDPSFLDFLAWQFYFQVNVYNFLTVWSISHWCNWPTLMNQSPWWWWILWSRNYFWHNSSFTCWQTVIT